MPKIKCWVKGGFIPLLITIIIFVFVGSTPDLIRGKIEPDVCVANSKIDASVLEAGSVELGGSGVFGYDDRQGISMFTLLPRGGKFFAKNAEAELELPLTYIHTPESEVPAFGININALYHLNTGTRFIPFVLLGTGPVYVAGKISSTTSLPLLSQAGIGLKYFFSKRTAFRFEYRFRHFSDPFTSDSGIDSDSFLFGISIFPSR